jgi:serine/threonine-protein kinase
MSGTPPPEGPQQAAISATLPGASIAPGGVIGDLYRILGPLGSGGMGVVLLAEDTRLTRRVAVKLVSPKARTERALDRFVDEARAMARVNHPNVVSIFAFGRHGGLPYFVMEYVQGETLSYWRRQQTIAPPLDKVMPIIDQLCRGVEAIHRSGTVHGDIKPSNVLIETTGRVAVADLGLSRTWSKSPTGVPLRVVGTPAYMAPE